MFLIYSPKESTSTVQEVQCLTYQGRCRDCVFTWVYFLFTCSDTFVLECIIQDGRTDRWTDDIIMPIADHTKIFHMMCLVCSLKFQFLILGILSPQNFKAEKLDFNFSILWLYCKYFYSGTSINQKTALQTWTSPSHYDITLVHKWKKIAREFRLTEWAAIMLHSAVSALH